MPPPRTPDSTSSRRRRILLGLLVAALVVLGGREVFVLELRRAKEERFESLTSIAHIKVEQVAHWRRTQLGAVERMARRPLFRDALHRWRLNDYDPAERASWEARLQYELRREVPSALLVAPNGLDVLAESDASLALSDASRAAIRDSLYTGRATLSEPFATGDSGVFVDAVAPVRASDGSLVAVLVLRVDPRIYLYPIVYMWPTPSTTAETLLVHREGEEVVFISPMRHWHGPPLSLRTAMWRRDLPEVQAVLGWESRLEGVDRRGVEVIADIRAIPDSNWHMVTKMDLSEIVAASRGRTVLGLAIFGLLMVVAAGVSAYVYNRRQSALFRQLYLTERQQREDREQFRTILYSIGDAVITTDDRARIEIMNSAATRLTGWSEDEARGRTLGDVFDARDSGTREPMPNPAERVLQENRSFRFDVDVVLVARDGSARPIADSAAPIRGENGAVCGAVLVFRDRSDERAAEQALRDSEARFRHLANALPQLVWTANPDGVVDFYNERHREYVGIQRSEDGFEWQPVVHPDELEPTIEAWKRAQSTGHPYEMEHRVRRRDGSFRWLLSRAVPVRDREGRIVKWFGSATDIDDLKTVQQRLAESEARYRALFENMNEAFAVGEPILDATGAVVDVRLVQVNRAFERETGLTVRVLDRPLREVLPDVEAVWIQAFAGVLETGRSVSITEFNRGTGRYYELFCFRPAPGRFSLLFRNVTDRVRAEADLKRTLAELKRSNTDLEHFAFAASHDLKSPLRAIESLAQWLDEDLHDRLDGEHRQHLRLLRQRSRRMARLLDDLLGYARAGATGRAERVEVGRLLVQVREFLDPPPGMRIELLGPMPILVTPIAPLRQVFTNLIGNAIKHHDRDSGLITITAREMETCVEFAIEDDGPGVPLEFRKRVFEMFQTLRPRDEVEGSGMGLAIVRRTVEACGGSVDLDAAGVRGTIVRVRWPRQVRGAEPLEATLESDSRAVEEATTGWRPHGVRTSD